jgi:predicted transcriptional regulator
MKDKLEGPIIAKIGKNCRVYHINLKSSIRHTGIDAMRPDDKKTKKDDVALSYKMVSREDGIINVYSEQPVDSPYAQELQDKPSKINANDQPETTQHKKYRSRYDIFATILEVASQKEANQTHIMYGAFMSFYQLRKYVAFLLNNGLLIKKQPQQQPIYNITEKGVHFLRLYEQLAEMFAEDK